MFLFLKIKNNHLSILKPILKQKFNEIFENDDEAPFEQNVKQVNTDITVFNGSDTLCNYTTLSNMHYDSMYSKDSLYDESFKINKSSKFINDNKTLEEIKYEMDNKWYLAHVSSGLNKKFVQEILCEFLSKYELKNKLL